LLRHRNGRELGLAGQRWWGDGIIQMNADEISPCPQLAIWNWHRVLRCRAELAALFEERLQLARDIAGFVNGVANATKKNIYSHSELLLRFGSEPKVIALDYRAMFALARRPKLITRLIDASLSKGEECQTKSPARFVSRVRRTVS